MPTNLKSAMLLLQEFLAAAALKEDLNQPSPEAFLTQALATQDTAILPETHLDPQMVA